MGKCKTVKGKTYTGNELPFYVKTPPPPPAVVTTMDPPVPYPGNKVILKGSGFNATKGKDEFVMVVMRPLDDQPIHKQQFGTIYYGPDGPSSAANGELCLYAFAHVLNDTQCEVRLPVNLTYPGRYRLTLWYPSTTAKGWDEAKEWLPYTVKGYKYKLSFTKLSCAETYAHPTPSSFYGQGILDQDGIFTQWIVIHDNDAYAKNTGVVIMNAPDYPSTGFGKHSVDSYTGSGAVYQTDNTAGDVRRVLAVGTSLFYYSGGTSGVKPDTQTIDGLVDLASVIGTAFGQPEVAAVAAAVGEVLKLIEGWLFSEDPKAPILFQLGERADATWTVLELQTKTNNQEGRFTGQQQFLGPKSFKMVVDTIDGFGNKTWKSVPVQADYTAEYQVQRVK